MDNRCAVVSGVCASSREAACRCAVVPAAQPTRGSMVSAAAWRLAYRKLHASDIGVRSVQAVLPGYPGSIPAGKRKKPARILVYRYWGLTLVSSPPIKQAAKRLAAVRRACGEPDARSSSSDEGASTAVCWGLLVEGVATSPSGGSPTRISDQ